MKLTYTVLLSLITGLTIAQSEQQPSVENSLFGVQTGILGVWAHNELRLTNTIALRTEIGLDTGVYDGMMYSETKYIMIPVVALEPRWYHNLSRRVGKDKNISGNSGNFLTLKALYAPDWFKISNDDAFKPLSQIALVPKYGLRRVYGKHFSFELGAGVGVVMYSGKNKKYYLNDDTEGYIDLHLRLGYHF